MPLYDCPKRCWLEFCWPRAELVLLPPIKFAAVLRIFLPNPPIPSDPLLAGLGDCSFVDEGMKASPLVLVLVP